MARQQVGAVGFQHQPVGGNLADQLAQVVAAALVADPAGQADMQVEVQVAIERRALAGEAVYDCLRNIVTPGLEDLQHAAAGIALVDEQRQAALHGQAQLGLEGMLLFGGGGEIAVEVEAAFAHRDHLGLTVQLAHVGLQGAVPLAGIVGVHAGGSVQAGRAAKVATGQLDRLDGVLAVGAGENQLAHIGRPGTPQHGVEVVAEARMSEVGADIHQRSGADPLQRLGQNVVEGVGWLGHARLPW